MNKSQKIICIIDLAVIMISAGIIIAKYNTKPEKAVYIAEKTAPVVVYHQKEKVPVLTEEPYTTSKAAVTTAAETNITEETVISTVTVPDTATEAVTEPEKVQESSYYSEIFDVDSEHEPMYTILCGASKDLQEAEALRDNAVMQGFFSMVLTTTDWSNYNSEKWYIVTAGTYSYESDAYNMLPVVQTVYPDAYVKYSGEWIKETNKYSIYDFEGRWVEHIAWRNQVTIEVIDENTVNLQMGGSNSAFSGFRADATGTLTDDHIEFSGTSHDEVCYEAGNIQIINYNDHYTGSICFNENGYLIFTGGNTGFESMEFQKYDLLLQH